MSKADFITQIASAAVEDMKASGVLASITIAQGALESAWGKSAPGNNLFGIKGSGTTQSTKEFFNGQWITIKAGFRAYQDCLGSIKDHSKFLIENGRYARAGFFDRCREKDYKGAAWALQKAGYATDPQYANKLIQIIEANGLAKFDLIEEEDQQMKEELEALKKQVEELKWLSNMPVPEWAKEAVEAAVQAKMIDTDVPITGSYDFYRVITAFHKAGKI